MKLQVAFLLSSFLATASCAATMECTAEQVAAIVAAEPEEDAGLEAECPVLSTLGLEVLNPNVSTATDALSVAEPCNDPACTTFLRKATDKTPACQLGGVSAKDRDGVILELCKKLVSGSITDDAFKKSFADHVKNTADSLPGEASTEEDGVVLNATIATTVPTTLPSPSPATNAIMPAAALTTSSTVPYLHGAAAIATAAVVSALVV